MPQRYNIALLPTDPETLNLLVEISQKYFLNLHDNYILGERGLPHITLCQFYAPDRYTAIRAYTDLADTLPHTNFSVEITDYRTREGHAFNSGFYISEYNVHKSETLKNLQAVCSKTLILHNMTSLTSTNNYAPHFTLARLRERPPMEPSLSDLGNICKTELSVQLHIGTCSETGVFIERIEAE